MEGESEQVEKQLIWRQLLTALGLGQPSRALSPLRKAGAGLSSRKTNRLTSEAGEKLCRTADSPPGRRRRHQQQDAPQACGTMLSFQAAEAGAWLQVGLPGSGARGDRRGGRCPSRQPGRGTHKHPGVPGPGSTRSCARAWSGSCCSRGFRRQRSGRAGTKPPQVEEV